MGKQNEKHFILNATNNFIIFTAHQSPLVYIQTNTYFFHTVRLITQMRELRHIEVK